jgi:hypothetical protein
MQSTMQCKSETVKVICALPFLKWFFDMNVIVITKLCLINILLHYLYPGTEAQKNSKNQNCVAPQLGCSRKLFSRLPWKNEPVLIEQENPGEIWGGGMNKITEGTYVAINVILPFI